MASAHAPDGVLTAPADGAVVVTSQVTVAGSFAHDDPGIASVTIRVVPVDATPGAPVVDALAGGGRGEVLFRFSPPLAYNGSYEVAVEGESRDDSSRSHQAAARTVRRRFTVNAPPAVPTDLTAQVTPDRAVEVTWERNSEPDMVGYQMQRAAGSDGWSVLAEVRHPATGQRARFLDESTRVAGGTYQYRVVAVRRGAQPDQGVVSDASPSVAAAVPEPATTPGPPSPQPTTPVAGQSTTTTSAGTSGGPGVTEPEASRPNEGRTPFERSKTVDLSESFAELQRSVAEAGDPGFDQTLPFMPPPPPATTVPPSAGAIAAALPDGEQVDRRSRVLPVALALLLFVGFMELRWLLFRLDDSDAEPPL